MIIRTMKIEQLLPAEYNSRKKLKNEDAEYEQLKKSINIFGYIVPLIWNKRTGRLVAGHQRAEVLRDLNHIEVQVSVVDLPEEKEKILNIALNKISGEWEPGALELLLEELQLLNIDMEPSGFSEIEIERILSKYTIPDGNEQIDEDRLAVLKTECLDCGFQW